MVIRFPGLFGDDPWAHSANTLLLIQNHDFTSADSYHGLFGLYSITAIFQIISNVDLLIITKWYPLFAVVVGGQMGFLFIKWLFNNDQLAILGGILFIITPQDMCLTLAQFWPTSLTVLIGTMNFMISLNLFRNNKCNFSMLPIFLSTGIVMFFIHDFTALLLIGGSIFVFIMQYWRNRGKNLQIIIIYIVVIIVSIGMRVIIGIGIVSDLLINLFSLSPLIWVVLVLGGFACLYVFKVKVAPVKQESAEEITEIGNNHDRKIQELKTSKKISDFFYTKNFIYVISGVASFIALVMLFLIPNSFSFSQINLPEFVLNMFFASTFTIIAAAGISSIQSKNIKTDSLYYWMLFFFLMFFGLMILDALIIHYYWWVRIGIIAGGVVSFGAICYLYAHIERKNLKNKWWKNIISIYLILLIICHASYSSANLWYNSESEIEEVAIYSEYIPKVDNQIITSFRWQYPFSYYSNNSINVQWTKSYLLKPENHVYPNGTNAIGLEAETFNKNNTFLLLDQKHMTLGILGLNEVFYGTLVDSELNLYTSLIYLNRVGCMRSGSNIFSILYVYVD